MPRRYFVYIMANNSRTMYVGMTNNIQRRITEHKNKIFPASFTKRYGLNKLVYFEEHAAAYAAISREKQLKNWHRAWKVDLIKIHNPLWRDLSDTTYV